MVDLVMYWLVLLCGMFDVVYMVLLENCLYVINDVLCFGFEVFILFKLEGVGGWVVLVNWGWLLCDLVDCMCIVLYIMLVGEV